MGPSFCTGLSGPQVARTFNGFLSLMWVAAWWSLSIQAFPLFGRHGILPLAEYFARATYNQTPTVFAAPSIFWLWASDSALLLALLMGLLASVMAFLGLWRRLAMVINIGLYVSFFCCGKPFLPTLADLVLVETSVVFLCVPLGRPSCLAALMMRLMVLKIYLQPAIQLWQAPHNLWHAGVGITALLAHAPLPTPIGWQLSTLSPATLSLIGRIALMSCCILPPLSFGPKPLRMAGAVGLTALQLGIALCVNCGLFCFLAVALHLFLLTDSEANAFYGTHVPKVLSWVVPKHARDAKAQDTSPLFKLFGTPVLQQGCTALLMGAWLWVSFFAQTQAFAGWPLISRYQGPHVDGRARFEALIEAEGAAGLGQVTLWHQPSDLWRPVQFVAPHQPRLDVALSLVGQQMSESDDVPFVMARLVEVLCETPHSLGRLVQHMPDPPFSRIRVRVVPATFALQHDAETRGTTWQLGEPVMTRSFACGRPRKEGHAAPKK